MRYLSEIELLLKKGHVAILGSRRIGKTWLLRQIISRSGEREVPVYVAGDRLSISPENLAIEVIGNTLYSFYKGDYASYLDLGFLLSLKSRLTSPAAQALDTIANELQKIKPDQNLILRQAFGFPGLLDRKVLMVIDDFENLFDLNNYSQVGDFLKLMNFNSGVKYVVTSSLVSESEKMLKQYFQVQKIEGLDKDEAASLIESKLGKADAKTRQQITELSSNPFVIAALCDALKSEKNVQKALLDELLDTDSKLYRHFSEIYLASLSHARGQGLLKSILNVLSRFEGLTLTEISRKVFRSAPVTKSLLERLMSVDLVVRIDGKFRFADPILARWVRANITTLKVPA
ncbi:MAG: hypothetical protein ABH879_09175 [archaeon]